MEQTDESTADVSHGFTLLRGLNLQRGRGQFCDCVIQLHVHPGRIFLAHRSVLAAFSPVLASLLLSHGALVDLNLPYLTPETLDILLNYIYTGTLPPQSQEEPVLSAAVHLQMDQLQQALRWRRKALEEITHSVQDKPYRKRRFVEEQSLDVTPLASPSYYPHSSEQPVSSSPSCEVVPVICHVSMAGTKGSKFPLQAHCPNRDSTFNAEAIGNVSSTSKNSKEPSHYGYPQPSHGLHGSSLLDQIFEPTQSKQEKLLAVLSESSLIDLPGVVSEKVGQYSSSGVSGELPSTLSEDVSRSIGVVRSKADSKGHCAYSAQNIGKGSPETKCGQTSIHGCPRFNRCDSSGGSKCVSDADSIQTFNPLDSGKGEHVAELLSNTFESKNLHTTGSNPLEYRSVLSGQFSEICHEIQAPLCLEGSDTNEACERRTSDTDAWLEINRTHGQMTPSEGKPLEISTTETAEPPNTDLADSYEFSKVKSYQGCLRYQCLQEHGHSREDSSDSDSDQGCPKDRTTVLETTDMKEISFLSRQASRSPGELSVTHPFQCSMCDRAFSQRGSLNRHMRSHLGVRPYSCPQCSMTFSRQYRVTEHMRVHQRSCEGPSEGHPRTASTGMDV